MTSRGEQITYWFHHLVELSTEDRQVALRDADISETLRAELQALIEIDSASGNGQLFAGLQRLNVAKMLPVGFDYLGLLGTELGQYRLVELLGCGGFGVVFGAVRCKNYQQRVAIKILRHDVRVSEIIGRRFDLERQLLANLQHENITRILDAGETVDGHPYYVMEYIDGQQITVYANQRRLTIDERIALFLQVCDAVGQAHQLGIVHRDLKPSNILVTSDGVVKLVDFGIAKVIDGDLGNDLKNTDTGVVPLTPYYASPEQLCGQPSTLTSDVYSLGVILYELLAGVGPYTSEVRSLHLLTHQILDSIPLPPSRRLRSLGNKRRLPENQISQDREHSAPLSPVHETTELDELAAQRSTSPRNLCRRLRGDLDNIVLLAIRKESRKRYTSAEDLGRDLRRHQTCLPVRARGDSLTYVIGRHCVRNLFAILLSSALLVVLALGLWAFTWQRALLDQERTSVSRQKTVFERERKLDRKLIPSIIELRSRRQNLDAYNLANQLIKEFPQREELVALMRSVSADASIDVGVEGVEILMRPATDPDRPWQFLGISPYVGRVPLLRLHLCFRSPGRDDVVVLGTVGHEPEKLFEYSCDLAKNWQAPQGMIWVPVDAEAHVSVDGRKYEIPQAFYMDRCEVTNRDYQEFIELGGYENQSLWPDLSRDGKEIPFEQTIQRFCHPETGKPAPSTWPGGKIPPGMETHPVHGISWHEAYAYATFRGKSLPTMFHWTLAAECYHAASIVPSSNTGRSGTVEVGASHGIGVYGTEDMAGNVAEWCLNHTTEGLTYVLGGMWSDPGYMFSEPSVRDPFDRSEGAGIRCVQLSDEVPAEFLAPRTLERRDFSKIGSTPEYGNERIFREILRPFYDYVRDDLQYREEPPTEFHGYKSIRITFKPAYPSDDLAAVYFLLPDEKTFAPPYQPILCFPGATVIMNDEIEEGPSCYIDAGRAYICPELWGTASRQSPELTIISAHPRRGRDYDEATRRFALDLRRALDVAEQFPELLDMNKLAYYGYSWGAAYGPLMLAIEDRFKVSILHCGGATQTEANMISETSTYFPFVRTPTLMINCRNDAMFPLPAQEAMYNHLPLPPSTGKRHLVYDTDYGHFAPPEGVAGEGQRWLNEFFGAPRRR